MPMKIICDTHVLLFWANESDRLTLLAKKTLDENRGKKTLASSDMTLWEIAHLHEKGRIVLPPDVSIEGSMQAIITALNLEVLVITPEIAALSRSEAFRHQDPADRLIASTAIIHQAPLISADKKLSALAPLTILW
jgi:PIN domain nuclease of toxin-antitoxin system